MNQLENLKKFTTIVIDSSNIEYIKRYYPTNATTNPSLILEAAKNNIYKNLLNQAINYANKLGGSYKNKIINASDKLSVNIGIEILKHIPGHVSTEIDARLSFNYKMLINKAKKIINLYKENGIDKSRVLIKIAATWEGIKAAEILEKEDIHCNLTLIFSLAQAIACAEAKVYLISPFVGRIFDWYNQRNLLDLSNNREDPGVKFVRNIYKYFKKYNFKTIIMGASFRNIDQILALSGCDSLTISPVLLEKLYINKKMIIRNLVPNVEHNNTPSPLSESNFRWEHNQNEMAVNNLSNGIRKFGIAQDNLEKLISAKL